MKHFLLLFLLGSLIASGSPTHAQPAELDVHFHEVLRLGDDETKPMEYLFGRIASVAADSESNIYVFDRMGQEVRVFSSDGEYLRTIGREGRGPGEFQRVRTITVNDHGELIVPDGTNRRITRFAPDGEVLEARRTNEAGLTRPVRLWQYKPGAEETAYIAFTKQAIPDEKAYGHDHLFHLFDASLREKKASFASDAIIDQSDIFVRYQLANHPGSALSTHAGDILYAPGLYDGTIYRYADTTDAPSGTIEGYVETDGPSYVRLDPDRDDYNTYVRIHSIEQDEPFAGRPLRMSIGLFQLNTGELVHFTYYNHDTHAHLGAEVFSEDGTLMGYGRVEEDLRAQIFPPALQFTWMDDEDRLYLIDRNEAPVVRVVEFEYEVVE